MATPPSSSLDTAAFASLSLNERVRLHGLQRTELNDAVGKVIGPPAANGRVPVLLNAPHNKTALIEPENLEKVLGAQPAATSLSKRARAPVLGRAAARREAVPAVHAVRRLQVRRVLPAA